ncbi:MAG: PAS domain S-box protein, partial [Deltaproteobacteria bacterium]|nr:PAS domain S-box protein [Deltaproteobacteria bacterium]
MLFSEVLFDLINNAALLLALVVLYDSIQVKPPTTRPIAGLIPGMIIGLICLLVMVRPVELVPGIVFDTRTILLGLTGFFFGPVPTAVAAVMAVLFRIYQGGSGVWMGMATIATAAILGLLWRRLRRNRDLPPPWWEFYLFGCVVHGAMLFWMLALPRPFVSAAFTRIGPVVMLLYPLGTALLGTFLCRRQLHHQMEKELLASESRYRNLYENSQAVMWIVDPASGAIVDANEAAVRFYGWEKEQLKKKKVSDINILSEAEIALEMERARTLRRGHFEFRHRLADGSIRDVEVISGPIVLQDRPLLYSIIHDISIRKRAEQALKESEEKYRKYIEHAPCGILIVNGRGEFLEVNDIACRLSGYAREEFSKMTLFDFTLPENRQLSLENFQGLLTTGEYSGIHRYVMKSGALLWCAVNAVRIGEDSLMLFLVDLTEAKHLESLLQEREQQLRRAQRIARLGGWEADLGSGRLQFSAEAGAIFGLDDRAWTLEEVSNLRHPDYRELISQRFKELIEGGRPFDEEYPIRRASDGEHRFVRTIAEYDPQRRLVMGTVQDITLREQAEAALHESEARFRLLVERAPEAIYVGVGPEGRFAYVNPAGLRLFGVASEAELLGLQARGFIHPDCHAAVQERVELLQQGRTDIPPQEEVYLRLDGSPVEVEAIPVPILFRGEKAALVFVRDITERRMAERALKESEAKYRQYIEAAPCGVFVLNGRAEFLEVNDAACRLSGYGREELLGRTPDLFSLPDDKGSVRRYFQELEETGYYAAIDPYANKDGAMVWWSVSAIRTEEGRYIAFVVDMTKEKRLEFLARDWGKQLNRAQRIARLGSWEADLESRRFRPS